MKVIDYLNLWFNVYKKPRLKHAGQVAIELTLRLHVPGWLKEKDIKDVKVIDLDMAISLIPPSRTQKYLHDVLKSAFKKAYALEYISKDISSLIEPVKYNIKNGESLTLEELEFFCNRVKGHKLERLFYFYMLTGCRRSEALTLRWQDVDFNKRQLLLRGSKTPGSFRLLPMSDELYNLLYPISMPGGVVFNYLPDYVTKQFKKLLNNHSLKDLRHTFATLCAFSGVHPTACQKLLGHTKIDTTMRIYTHVQFDYVAKELKKVKIFNQIKIK